MKLRKYHEKRQFERTPEPRGKLGRKRARNRAFVIHKHAARSLHHDLRLELDGVLMSWAVPKGPPQQRGRKVLAVRTEDHPLEYGDFEGVIPDGYGAGVVMLWDSGTWIPESPDVEAALAKGDLKFRLDGYKLKGSWVLVRTRGYARQGEKPSGPSWLLIKHRDEWSGDLDIAEFAPLSVKTGDDFPAIMAAQDPALWLTNRRSAKSATGAMLQEVIKQAAELKLSELQEQEQEQDPPPAPRQRRARKPKT
jgi:bifunctional non-homologous end joining protein LigD